MKIPRLEAPSEAEAECANLQEKGIVDAIWSEDADALTFGATFLIRDFRVPKGKEGEFGFQDRETQKFAEGLPWRCAGEGFWVE